MVVSPEYDQEANVKKEVDEESTSHILEHDNTWTTKLLRLAGSVGIEQRGIERVLDEERTDTNGVVNVGTTWLAANMVVSSFALGVLGVSIFNLGLVDSILTILFINILGILPVCFFSTFGPVLGLRQMVLSRFYFGYHGVKIIAMLNVLACIGWSSVNTIVGAQLFHAVNNDVPGYAGVLVIAAGTFLVTLFGYKVVHAYEFWSWIPTFIVFLIVLGEFVHSGKFSNLPMGVGTSEAGAVLSFAASIFGYSTGWASCAADYTCYQPVTTSRAKVFVSTFLGLAFPLLFTQFLGAAVATAMINTPAYADGYADSGIGGLLAAVLFPPLGRFGAFCLTILALCTISNNAPNVYSVSLSAQVLARWTANVPRFIWTLLATCCYIAISITGYSHFEDVLEDFMLVIAYWLAIYEGVSFTEHIFFKKRLGGYDPAIYNKPSQLPPGLAAIVAFCFGVFGAVMGMAQVWFTGPIGKLCGGAFGGDVGFELAFAFSAITYGVLRPLEYRYFKR